MSSPIVIRLRHGILRVEPHIVGLSFRSAEKHFEFIHDGFFVVFMSSDNTRITDIALMSGFGSRGPN
jgi:hypothetical protein